MPTSEPLPGKVVGAACRHQGQNLDDEIRTQRLLTRERVSTHAGKRGSHHGKILASYRNIALAEIKIKSWFGIVFDNIKVSQQMTDYPIAISG